MIKKICLCLTILFSLCINVCAEDISYDYLQKKINNTGKFAIVKYEDGLYFSGEEESVEVPLEKGNKITLLRWDSYKNIRPISEPADYTLYEISYVCDGVMVDSGYGFKECEIKTPSHLEKIGYRTKWSVTEKNDYKLIAQAEYELIDYKVSFVADGQEISCPTYNINNQIVTEPAVPRKDGYIGKWESYTLTYGDKVVNAVYTPIEYTVTFESENDVIKKTFNVENMNVEEPQLPEKAGYTVRWEDYTLSLNNITVKAIYEVNTYKVDFVAKGENVATKTYTVANMDVTEPTVPEKAGYTGKWESYELNLSDITVNAVYTPVEYKVTFKAENFTDTKIFTVENMTVEKPEVPEKAGYTVKWEDYTLSLNDITVKAIYEVNEYKVDFVAKGEIVATEKYTIENMNVAKPLVPAKAGYTGKWESYELKLSDITVNAIYTPVEYKVTFKAENFTETQIFTVENMNVEEPEVPEKAGYTVEWEDYTLGLSDLTVSAVYTPNIYTVTFDCTDGEIEVTYGEKYPALPVPENNDETEYFIGWYFGEMLVAEGNRIEITEDVCLVAKWAKKPVYKVTYNNYYEDGTSMSEDIIEGENAVAPVEPTKIGYKFVKWQTTAGDEYDFATPITENISLYSVWEVVEYAVTFVADDDVVWTGYYTVENREVTEPEVPEKSGYTKEWENYTLTYGDTTVNAIYTPIEYTITFIADDKEISIQKFTVENMSISQPEVPTKKGYTSEWTEYSLDLSDCIVKAIYTPIEYTVTFMADDVFVGEEKYTVENKVVNAPSIPEKRGYIAKWEVYDLELEDLTVNAIYTPEIYHIYFVDENGINTLGIVDYTVENRNIIEPEVPDKMGYTGKWQEYSLDIGDVTVYPQYTIINYKVTFMADGNVVATESYTITNKQIQEPAVPQKTGYTGEWPVYDLNYNDCVIKAIYAPIEYTVTFMADEAVVYQEKYTIENIGVHAPSVPEKIGYTAKWATFDLNLEDITVNAIYTPIEYTITFIADGKEISVQKYNIENMNISKPEIPAKEGYTAKWEDYSLDFTNKNVKAIYTPIEYVATFIADGVIVSQQKFSAENMQLDEPEIPAKAGYTTKWQSYTLKFEDITIDAVYEVEEYTIVFVAEGNIVSTKTFNVETASITEPQVPQKEWYDGRWEAYTLGAGDVTVNAIYTLATYTISFVADGVEIGTQTYNKNNQTVSLPAIPVKADHRAMWEKYEIVPGGMTINVRYISKETDKENEIEKLRYTSMLEHFKKHNFTGNERKVVENVQKVGQSILEDIEYGIIITDEHIKEKYGDIIKESKEIYQNITNQNRFKAEVMRLFKNDAETYEYFEAFAEKYL